MKQITETLFLMGTIRNKMNDLLIAELKARGITGIVPTHGGILMTLYSSSEPKTMKEIAEKIGRTQPTVTVLVDKLQKLGYLNKVKSATDGRVTYLELTKKGWDFKNIFLEISYCLNERLHRTLSDNEEKILVDILKKMSHLI